MKEQGLELSLWTQFSCSFQSTTWVHFFLLLLPLTPHHTPFLPSPLSFCFHFLSPFDITHRIEKFFEFLGQVGCLVGLGDLLTETWLCSQDVRSPGAFRVPAHCIGLCSESSPTSPMAKGSETLPVNWGSVEAGAHSPTFLPLLTWKEGQCVLNTHNTSRIQDLLPFTQSFQRPLFYFP